MDKQIEEFLEPIKDFNWFVVYIDNGKVMHIIGYDDKPTEDDAGNGYVEIVQDPEFRIEGYSEKQWAEYVITWRYDIVDKETLHSMLSTKPGCKEEQK